METLFLICAVAGGTVLLCQFALTLLGLGGESFELDAGHGGELGGYADHGGEAHLETPGHDANDHAQHGSTWLFGVLTFRTLVTFIAFFGMTGMAGTSAGWTLPVTIVAAVAAGAASMYGVQFLLRGMARLRSDGTVQIARAVGQTGTVYLTVPAKNSGAGKIQLVLQNRTMEYEAVTPADKLPTGARVVVTRVLGPDRLEVAAAE